MNSKLTKLIGALSIATLATVGCKSDGDNPPPAGDGTTQGQPAASCSGATGQPADGKAGGTGSSCSGGTGGR